MSEQRTVGSLTADDVGSVIEAKGTTAHGTLTRVDHVHPGWSDVGWTRLDFAEGGLLFKPHDTPCTVTPGGPQ